MSGRNRVPRSECGLDGVSRVVVIVQVRIQASDLEKASNRLAGTGDLHARAALRGRIVCVFQRVQGCRVQEGDARQFDDDMVCASQVAQRPLKARRIGGAELTGQADDHTSAESLQPDFAVADLCRSGDAHRARGEGLLDHTPVALVPRGVRLSNTPSVSMPTARPRCSQSSALFSGTKFAELSSSTTSPNSHSTA